MNKRFSTLLAAALVAGSFSSAFAQLEAVSYTHLTLPTTPYV